MESCYSCNAKFGKKFDALRCSLCGQKFCRGHLIKTDQIVYHKTIIPTLQPERDGVCIGCLLQTWQKNDESMQAPTGMFSRVIKQVKDSTNTLANFTGMQVDPLEKIKLVTNAGAQIVSEKTWMVFLHQQNWTKEAILQNLIEIARIQAISTGRRNERDFCLSDVYKVVEWMKSHPVLPNFAHNISWDFIERTPQGLAIVTDAWHLTFTALAFTNPVTGTIEAAKITYHMGDRVVDQATGKSLMDHAYDGILSKIGLNFNPIKAITVYIAGNMILQLYSERK